MFWQNIEMNDMLKLLPTSWLRSSAGITHTLTIFTVTLSYITDLLAHIVICKNLEATEKLLSQKLLPKNPLQPNEHADDLLLSPCLNVYTACEGKKVCLMTWGGGGGGCFENAINALLLCLPPLAHSSFRCKYCYITYREGGWSRLAKSSPASLMQ